MGEFVPVIRACAAVGIPAPTMWDMELWEIAAAIGVGEPKPKTNDSQPSGLHVPRPGAPIRSPSGRDLVAERIRAAREGGPPPAPDPGGTLMGSTVSVVPGRLPRGA